MADLVGIYRTAHQRVQHAGTSIEVMRGPIKLGLLTNPFTAADQGLPIAEELYYSFTGPAETRTSNSTFVLNPGEDLIVPEGVDVIVYVTAPSAGHKFSAIVVQDMPTPAEIGPASPFPPSGPTGLIVTLPSYLYQQYIEDDDCQAFVRAYNELSQYYVDWFNTANLPDYRQLTGAMLDWVGEGLYGLPRPTFSTGTKQTIGPFDTWAPNEISLNDSFEVGYFTAVLATDDIYKRILTWHIFKGDGRYFSTRWLKRRIYRFLYGENGYDISGETYRISVIVSGEAISITILGGSRTLVGGAMPDAFACDEMVCDDVRTTVQNWDIPALASVMKEGIDTGLLEMPYQYSVSVQISQPV